MAKKEKSSLKMTPPVSETQAESNRPVSRDEFLKEAALRKAESGSQTQTGPLKSVESKEKPSPRSTEPASNEAPVQDFVSPHFPLMEIFFPPLLWKQMAQSMKPWLELFGRFYRLDALIPPFFHLPNRPPLDFGMTAMFRCMNPLLQQHGSCLRGEAADREDPLAMITDRLSRIVEETLDVDKIEKKQAAGQFLSYEEQRRWDAAEKLKELKETIEGMPRPL